jgi:signal transduction histidine kinase
LLAVAAALWFVGWPDALAYRAPLALAALTPPERRRPALAHVALAISLAVTPLAQSLPAAIALAAATVLAGALRRDALPGAAVLGVTLAGGAVVAHTLPGASTVALTSAYGAGLVIAAAVTVLALQRAEWSPLELADTLNADDTVEAFRDALARAVADPSLSVSFEAPRAGRVSTVVAADGAPVAWLEHRAGALDDPALLDAVSVATRLQAANVRLQHDLAAQADALAASGRRLLAAGDEQRRRLERRVRAGPIARLEVLDERLETFDAPELSRARADLAASLEELRTLAVGLHPGTGMDLDAAVAALAARTPVAASVAVSGLPALPDPVRSALLFTCAEALANVVKHAAAQHVDITLAAARGSVRLTVDDDGRGGADPAHGSGLLGLRDRLELIGGTLDVTPGARAGTRLLATIPCEASG